MANDTKSFNQNGYLMLNGPDDTLWIPRSSNKSWLTLFYALPRVMVEKQKEYLSLPRCPYEVLRTEKYDELINDDLFLQLVWDCYAWMIFQRIPIPLKDGTYRFIPGADLHYSGNFPLWRISYYMVGIMRDMFEQFGTSFQALFKVKKGDEIPYIPYEKWAVFIGDMTTAMTKRYNTPHRTHPIKAMLTEEEYAGFSERCKIYGLSQAEMIRQSLEKVAIHPIIKVSVVDDKLLSEIGGMTAEFGKVGSNLNQIAKVLNEFHAPYPELADDVKTAVSNLANLKFEVLKKVGDAIGNDKTYKL